jgi:serine/threonine-protein kinase
MSAVKSGQQVSRYVVLGKLARGGMAEVWLARQRGRAGFEKTLVLKTISSPFNENPAFVEMFLTEARLAALINHPNVVQIFDLSDEQGEPFIAMEYLEGRNLAQVHKALWAVPGRLWEPGLAVRLVAECCAGLDFAHNLKDSRGTALNIIHRDVTPENIFVTYQGHVKILDFGIAKATASSSLTKPGNIRGKLLFLAPEQVLAQALDRRVDVWALGVNLYLLLTGHHPFDAVAEVEVMRAITEARPRPPSELRPGLPPMLDAIVLRALEKDRERRYPSVAALRLLLEEYLSELPPVGAFHLETQMELLFPAATDPIRQKLSVLLALPTEEIVASLSNESTVVPRPTPTAPASSPREMDTAEFAAALKTGAGQPARTEEPAEPLRPVTDEPTHVDPPPFDAPTPTLFVRNRKKGKALPLGLAAAAVLLVVGVVWGLRIPGEPAVVPPPPPTSQDVPPPAPPEEKAPATPDPVVPPDENTAARPANGVNAGALAVSSNVRANVYLDGRLVGKTPLRLADVPRGDHRLRVVYRVPEGTAVKELVVPVMAGVLTDRKVNFGRGRLNIRVSPWAEVKVDGRRVGVTPLKPISLLEGEHEVTLANSELKAKKTVRVTVEAGRDVELKVKMAE